MWKRLFPAAFSFALLALPLPAAATDYTDIWFLASESGYGFNMVQGDGVIFITFFIYGSGNTPTWVVATMGEDSNGNFSGNLYSTVGSYYGAPWNPATYAPTLVGTASFSPIDPYDGTLTYVVNGVTVTKTIQRQTLVPISLSGAYVGGQAGSYGGSCTLAAYEDTFFPVTVTELTDGSVTFQFTYTQSGLSCTLSGKLVAQGQLYSIPSASYVCSDGTNTKASVDEIKATATGIEGRFNVPSGASGIATCTESAGFSGILYGTVGAAAKGAVERTRTDRSPTLPRH